MTVIPVTIGCEGITDEAALRRLCAAVGRDVAVVHVAGGKTKLDPQLAGYNSAARFAPWLVVRDLNGDAGCAPALVRRLLPKPSAKMSFRVSVRALESWLMADRDSLARYLRVGIGRIPADPDAVPRPKVELVKIASASRMRAVREDMVPRPGSGTIVGPNYEARIIEYATTIWDPVRAAGRSDSLRRCLAALRALPAK